MPAPSWLNLMLSERMHNQAIPLLSRGLDRATGDSTERFELLLHLDMALTPSDPIGAVACYRQALGIPLDARINRGHFSTWRPG